MNYGKGIDIGTSRLVAMWVGDDGKEVVKTTRDCYFELKDEDMDFVKSRGDWKLVTINNRHFAIGEDSLQIANWLKQEVQRPMAKGILNPSDPFAYDILEEIISKLLGPPRCKGEICVASIPADSMDGNINTVAHKAAVKQILTKLGYTFVPINEGFATLLDMKPCITKNGENVPFTGIALSFGGGMVNSFIGYKAKKIRDMSSARSGDWVDAMVAKTITGVKPNQVTAFKEKYMSFKKEYTDSEIEAFGFRTSERKKYFRRMLAGLLAYYENLMEYTVLSLKKELEEPADPTLEPVDIEDAMEVVISGGTCTPEGFEDKFLEVINENEFPIQVTRVRKAENTHISTANGALGWAMHQEAKKQAKVIPPTKPDEQETDTEIK